MKSPEKCLDRREINSRYIMATDLPMARNGLVLSACKKWKYLAERVGLLGAARLAPSGPPLRVLPLYETHAG